MRLSTDTVLAKAVGVAAAMAACLGCSKVGGGDPSAAGSSTSGLSAVTVTQGGDELRTSWYSDEAGLSPSIVSGPTFGQMFSTSITGQVFAQPLVSQGTLFVATEANYIYGMDPQTGNALWSRFLGTPFASSDLGCGDIAPNIGITGTPVIDQSTNIAYFFVKTYASGSSGTVNWVAHAVSVATGAEQSGFPVLITGSAANDSTQVFAARKQSQRPGVLLLDGVVYAGFGSHCDYTPWQGWIVGVSTSGKITTLFCTQTGSNKTDGAGVWGGGGGLVSDRDGQMLFSTGNGGAPVGPLAGSSPPATLGDSVVRLAVQSNGTLAPTDFFTPYDGVMLDNNDWDLGSGGVAGLPSTTFGTTQYPNLALVVGKQGYIYLLNRDNLGGVAMGSGGGDAVVGRIGPAGGVWGKPAVWPGDGGYAYATGVSSGTTALGSSGVFNILKYGLDGTGKPAFSVAASSTDSFGFGSGSPVVTSSGTTSGSALVWVVWTSSANAQGAQLRAYDAVPVNGQPNLRFSAAIGQSAKFASPGIAGNRVYVGTSDGHVIGYGAPLNAALTGSGYAFGNVITGSTAQATITVTANSTVTVTGVSISPGVFTVGQVTPALPATLQAGATLSIPVTFAPTAAGMVAATVTVATSGTSLTMSVTGTGTSSFAQLVASPTSLSFGGTTVASEIDDSVTLSNVGGAALTINSVTAPAAPFGLTGAPASGTVLAPGAQVTMTASFDPTAIGMYMSSLGVTSTGGSVTVSMSGSCAAPGKMTISPASVSYGTVGIGASVPGSFTVTNTGGSPITITKSKPPSLGVFTATTSLAEGTTLYPNSSSVETVAFAPTGAGLATDQWVINSDDGNGLQTVQFSGTGVPDLTSEGTAVALVTQPTGGGNHNLAVISDGVYPPVGSNNSAQEYDTYNGTTRTEDWIGYQFPTLQTFGSVAYQAGMQFSNGGWFTTIGVQVLQSGTWVNVPNVTVSPAYPGNDKINYETYNFSFPAIAGTGIRIDGTPGGSSTFISCGELRAYQGVSTGPETLLASAGNLQTVAPGATVTLDASGSSSSNGDAIAYHWTQTAGPTVTLSNPSAVNPNFVAPSVMSPTTLTFSLVVSDGELSSSPSTVTVNTIPAPGPDITANGTAIALITTPTGGGNKSLSVISDNVFPAAGSADSSQQYDTYTNVTNRTEDWIGYQYASNQTFGSMVFQVGIQFPNGGWFKTLNVQVLNSGTWSNVPGVIATPAFKVNDGVNYETYNLAFPPVSGTGIRIDGAPGGPNTFVSCGELRVYQAANAPPETLTVSAGVAQSALSNTTLTLDGSGSSASNGDTITYAWTQTGGPAVTLSSTSSVKPTFAVPTVQASTALTFRLVVSDGTLTSSPATVTVTAIPLPAGTDITASGTAVALITNPTGNGNHSLSVISDGVFPGVATQNSAQEYDTYTGTTRTEDWIGYTFTASQNFGAVLFQPGIQFGDGGWFTSLNLQVLQSGTWVNVPGVTVTPSYPGHDGVNFEAYTFTFPSVAGTGIRIDGAPGGSHTFISVGELRVYQATSQANGSDITASGTTIALITKPTGQGNHSLSVISDGVFPAVGSSNKATEYDTYTGTTRTEDWIGYQFATSQNFGSVVFQPGIQFSDGGWFTSINVQVLQSGTWVNAPSVTMTPTYGGHDGTNFETYTFSFPSIAGTGIRIDGAPGGSKTFISVGELRVYQAGPFDVTASGTAIALITSPTGQGNHSLSVISDGIFPAQGSTNKSQQYDTYTGQTRTEDWIGYQFPATQTFGSVLFQAGMVFSDGGWFTSIAVQVLQSGTWVTVPGAWVTPVYAGQSGANYEQYTFSFPPIAGTGIRIDGAPGGSHTFISVGELRIQAP
jgi:PQQ-like domain